MYSTVCLNNKPQTLQDQNLYWNILKMRVLQTIDTDISGKHTHLTWPVYAVQLEGVPRLRGDLAGMQL